MKFKEGDYIQTFEDDNRTTVCYVISVDEVNNKYILSGASIPDSAFSNDGTSIDHYFTLITRIFHEV